MQINMYRIGSEQTIRFAFAELCRYLKRIEPTLMIRQCIETEYRETGNGLWIGISEKWDNLLPQVSSKKLDDAIYIDVKNGDGIITGTNPRAVLIAVYRYLKELGCAWVRPGPDGEILPGSLPESYSVCVKEAAAYRHRTICIEGAVSIDHVKNMIDWIPKASMNGYYTQFRVPFTFFDRWYGHRENPTLVPEQISYDDAAGMQKIAEEEIALRGLLYHTVGHGWTCEPFGIKGLGWDKVEDDLPDDIRKHLALVNGKREIWGGVPLNTNLCYSNPDVQTIMSDAVVEYCKTHPDVSYVHVWLADGANNHCECDECRKKRPADFYINILNEIDRKLSEADIDTKIVFLLYLDLLWCNLEGKIHNKDRFLLMFAPITRSYSKKYTDFDETESVVLAPYTRNKLTFPYRVEENIAYLRSWQSMFDGDSVDFDYHLMWDHLKDPGYYRCSEILFSDAQGLDKIGLNGYISCQNQRTAFPTALPLEMMARGLWSKNANFEDEAMRYFSDAFGEDSEKARIYLKTLSEKFVPPYVRGELKKIEPEVASSIRSAKETIFEFSPVIESNLSKTSGNVRRSWEYLHYHAKINLVYADMVIALAEGKQSKAESIRNDLHRLVQSLEPELHIVFDVFEYVSVTNGILAGMAKKTDDGPVSSVNL